MRFHRILILLGFAAFETVCYAKDTPGSGLTEKSFHPLFKIIRSVNRNVLIYEACVTPDNQFCPNPIHIYWIMKNHGDKTEPLTALERRKVYGVSIISKDLNKLTFAIKPIPSRRITVTRIPTADKGALSASILIGGKQARLREVFIQMKSGGLVPSVDYIEMRGNALEETNESVLERINGPS